MDKASWRVEMLATRRALAPAERAQQSAAVSRLIPDQPEWRRAGRIGCYLALPDEVPTEALVEAAWRAGKEVCLPDVVSTGLRFRRLSHWQEVRQGQFGLRLPPPGPDVCFTAMDLLLVPGVGFDRHGWRLGWGKAYYDRFLAGCPAPAWGVAWTCQVVDELPHAEHDARLHGLVTADGLTRFAQS